MRTFLNQHLILALGLACSCLGARAAETLRLNWYPSEPQVYSRFEIMLEAARGPSPFDPTQEDFSAQFVTPTGKKLSVPGFYYEPYTRVLGTNEKKQEQEMLVRTGEGGWRIRYCPAEVGVHRFRATLRRRGLPTRAWEGELTARPGASHGFVRVEPSTRRYFEFDDRTPMFLLGECCCWGGPRGTFSYDEWFAMHRSAGMNYARIWMSPWAFGIESDPNTMHNYRMDRAWALDYVLEQAEKNGIYLMLCFDYHGMLSTRKDRWGRNDNWANHPYHANNGGPCKVPGDFFTNARARKLYRDRLRYIVARWGYSTHILAWEFWNEVDICYAERGVTAKAVADWHEEMGAYLKQIDPNRHLVTTSFLDALQADDVWTLPQIDFTQSHSYNQPDPPTAVTALARDMYARFHKPTFVGEYGVASSGSKSTLKKDPLGNALHQALWSSTFSGAAGAAMPWWWDNYIHPEGLYVVWRTLSDFLDGVPMGSPRLTPARISMGSNATPRPTSARLFSERLFPETDWDRPVARQTIVVDRPPAKTRTKLFHAFLQGQAHADLRHPIRLRAWFGRKASLRLHVNSVSKGARIVVAIDGKEAYSQPLRDRDGKDDVCGEYDKTLVAPVPAGRHEVTVTNRGRDWVYLDWVEVVNARPASGLGGGSSVRAYGLASSDAAWVWLLNPEAVWPQTPQRAVAKARVSIAGLADGTYEVEWWDPTSATVLARRHADCRGGKLTLAPPEFVVDVAAKARRVE